MTSEPETVQVAALVTPTVAEKLRALARQNERSTAAELRLAIRSWIELSADSAKLEAVADDRAAA